MSETEKQNISALSTLAGGIVGGDSANAVAGAGAAKKNTVENNQLRGAEATTLI
ncbi:VENN motif pre-toxin domain-containing protein [Pseudomonas viridiflava]